MYDDMMAAKYLLSGVERAQGPESPQTLPKVTYVVADGNHCQMPWCWKVECWTPGQHEYQLQQRLQDALLARDAEVEADSLTPLQAAAPLRVVAAVWTDSPRPRKSASTSSGAMQCVLTLSALGSTVEER